jgi:hypothetical protein
LIHRAIALDGTCMSEFSSLVNRYWTFSCPGTGEHGVGVGKKEYLIDELGPNTVALMKTIKKAIDPLNIMNPGKVNSSITSPATPLTEYFQLYPDTRSSVFDPQNNHWNEKPKPFHKYVHEMTISFPSSSQQHWGQFGGFASYRIMIVTIPSTLLYSFKHSLFLGHN